MLDNVQKFKHCYEKFQEALTYINNNISNLKKDPAKWKIIQKNFKDKYEKTLDAAWESLTKDEQKKFALLYERRRETAKEEMDRIKRIAKMFNGKIVRITRR